MGKNAIFFIIVLIDIENIVIKNFQICLSQQNITMYNSNQNFLSLLLETGYYSIM